jgi:hypothetical protein
MQATSMVTPCLFNEVPVVKFAVFYAHWKNLFVAKATRVILSLGSGHHRR